MQLRKEEGMHQGNFENSSKKLKHPPGLYMLFLTEMWERFSYYGMRALLIIYLSTELLKGGLGFDKNTAALIYGYFTGFVYFTPIIGGYLSDKYLGQRKAIILGSIIMAIGQFSLFASQTRTFLYIGLGLLIIGNGFFKPNISTLVGQLYEDGDDRRDSAFTIFYMGINVGAFLAPLVCGTLAENIFAQRQGEQIMHYGFKYGFLAAAIGMIFGGILFTLLAQKYLGDIGKSPVIKTKSITENHEDVNRPLTKQEKNRTAVIFILTAFVVFFWAGFEQAGSSLTIYTKDYINRNAFGMEIPVSWFQSLNPVFIVILAPIVSKIWISLSKREQGDLKVPAKMALGMILLGVGFLLMVGAVLERGSAGDNTLVKANLMWLVGAYFLHTLGELCLSPIGLSMVSSLAPIKYASLLMGVWLMGSFIANIAAGYVASYVEVLGHLQIFGGIAAISIVLGAVLLVLSKKLVSMME